MAGGGLDKSPDAFRTISEVAEDLDLPQHVLRFWETRFTQIKPLKRGGGRRYYRPDDVDLLKGIRHLLYGEGYTIRGVQRILKAEGVRFVQAVGRGEESVAAPEHEAGESIAEDGEFIEPPLIESGQSPGRGALPEESLRKLQSALDELLECDRVLRSLKDGEQPISE
ncbi:MerR family transcriptional regulator [Microvirga makkahensis]|uniref:MerR family transcriptional regulator n=1 Tax=Microvirga makkahensis TaxID=1128670 RepID=A0A7X3MQ58_9HYPH|nr:MerR family transcriptional regulator [Microvirga makkahensis]MXQ10993.1 MerR family transcriptional regulator [Microvirga makkahensis]